ncbi:MAG: ABC transporter permease [Planctomycetes bacterium]|nr:ABC transporter permease [Planctomycetota bacterium]
MARYLIKRTGVLVATLLGITMLTFVCVRLLPGEVAAGDDRAADAAETRAAKRRLHALDRPLAVQYAQWLGRSVRLDFGHSWVTRRPVGETLREAAPRSLQVMIPAMVLWYLLGIPLGVFLALRHRTAAARLATAGLFALYSVPGFVAGTLLIVWLANPDQVAWFPASGLQSDTLADTAGSGLRATWRFLLDRVWHLALPVACMVYATTAYLAEQTRVSMLDSLSAPWVRTARSKGLSEFRVVTRHALRNAAIPLVTLAALALPAAFTGSVFIERIFSIQGIGWALVQAVEERDHPVVMAITTIAAGLTLLGILLSDLLYTAVDPRIELR